MALKQEELGAFDPESFMDAVVEQQMDTKLVPCPVGEWPALAGKPEIRKVEYQDKKTQEPMVMVMVRLPWEIDSAAVREVCQRDKVVVAQDIMLDLVPGSGALDLAPGKNLGLGRVREAVGMNTPGKPFGIRMVEGCAAKVVVSHRMHEEDTFAEVKKVLPL